jgi:hypothetical protein
MTSRTLTKRLESACLPFGLDVVLPLSLRWYNSAVSPSHSLHSFGRPDALALVVGNSKALWTPLLAHYRLSASPTYIPNHPMEAYVASALDCILPALCKESNTQFETYVGQEVNVMHLQKMLLCTGKVTVSTNTGLCIHPDFSSWFGVRAVVVLDVDVEEPAPLYITTSPPEESSINANWTHYLEKRLRIDPHIPHVYSLDQLAYHYHPEHRQMLLEVLGIESSGKLEEMKAEIGDIICRSKCI